MVVVPPQEPSDWLILLLVIVLVALAILCVDWLTKGGPPTSRYLLLDGFISFLIVILPPLVVQILNFTGSLFGENLTFGDLTPYAAFVIAIYGVKQLLIHPTYHTTAPDRTWENAIWVSFCAFVVYVIFDLILTEMITGS